MTKYRSRMQESLRTYDNPLEEDTSKLILSYLKFYGYIPLKKSIRYVDLSYKSFFTDGVNLAVLRFGENLAVLTEYDGLSDAYPTRKIDFIKQEKLEYLGKLRNRSIIYTTDRFRKSFYYAPINYQGMKDADYYENNIPEGTMPDEVRDFSFYKPTMMKIVASGEFANEIRCADEKEPVYQGKQVKR